MCKPTKQVGFEKEYLKTYFFYFYTKWNPSFSS